ncbi:MAG TPA: helix-hairpin-helix domain-containing protein, partial [Bacillota bacterium]|nr:helix-hairpin-helix domain-containing protein [Bacillota bacterium]
LEPLASLLLAQEPAYTPTIEEQAAGFVSEEKGISSAEEALAGACDIIAEDISDNADYRKAIRAMTWESGILNSKGEGDSVYTQYYEYSEPVKKIPGHRILAINRGEKEGFLKVTLTAPRDEILQYLGKKLLAEGDSPAKKYVTAAIEDAYDRLIAPSIEREIRSDMFDTASEGAIKVFAENLRHLLMQPPLRGRVVMGLDPGYRTGCKLAVVDQTGKVIDTAVIYPHKPQERIRESGEIVVNLIRKHKVNVIAIGNGTASKESEIFIANLLKTIPEDVKYIVVSEAGASVYSASKLGAEEFPDFDVTQRSAVSIARRLQDPLAELVKIDPKSIGVGQYQHDMKPARLEAALSGVVEDCVNAVGVDLNTASYSLLSYISGINATAAKNIVKYREEHGAFRSRAEILKVPKIGEKAFEQCAGFLRVPGSDEILDNTGVHPESYDAARRLLKMFGYTDEDVRSGGLSLLSVKVKLKGEEKVAAALGIGVPTLRDIIAE